MTDDEPIRDPETPGHAPERTMDSGTRGASRTPGAVTLEHLVTLTGEMEHLNELVVLHVERSGGFSSTESYFALVMPVLDRLETEIRLRCNDSMSKDQMKLIIQDWIDQEIVRLRP